AGRRPQGRHGGDPDGARAAGRALHRRDPPPEPGHRGAALPGDGGRLHRHRDRAGPGRAFAAARAEAVHAGRRDHPHRPPDDAASRPVRDHPPARLLRPGRDRADRPALGPAARRERRRGRLRRDRPPIARHAPRREPHPPPGPRLRPGASRRRHHPRRGDGGARPVRGRPRRPGADRPGDSRGRRRPLLGRPGGALDARRGDRRGARHHRGCLRALPTPARAAPANAARPGRDACGLRPPGPARAGARPAPLLTVRWLNPTHGAASASVDPTRPRRGRPPGGRLGGGPDGDRDRLEGPCVPAGRDLPARERPGPAHPGRHHGIGVHRRGLGDRERRRHRLGEHRLPRERVVAGRPHPHACDRAPARVAPGGPGGPARGHHDVPHQHGPGARAGRRAILPPVRTAELDYELPADLIAQAPVEPRSSARLLVYDRATREIRHRIFTDLLEELRPDDLVVVNNTRVLHARFHARRATGGAVELLLLEPNGAGTWDALARPARRLRAGETLDASGTPVRVEEVLQEGHVTVTVQGAKPGLALLERIGEMPVPPYIRRSLERPEDYQTVYARAPGSAAAPTAGLHFTAELWDELRRRFEVVEVTLTVGLDTFRPVTADDLADHPLHTEAYEVSDEAAAAIDAARGAGRRIVAVGTTT